MGNCKNLPGLINRTNEYMYADRILVREIESYNYVIEIQSSRIVTLRRYLVGRVSAVSETVRGSFIVHTSSVVSSRAVGGHAGTEVAARSAVIIRRRLRHFTKTAESAAARVLLQRQNGRDD